MASIQIPTVSEARLLSVLDTAVDGIIVMDDRARVLVFNKACETLFGYTITDVIGHNIKMLMPPEFSDHHDRYLSHYLETGERRIIGIGREVRGQHKDGTIFPLELSVGEAHTPDGRQFIGILRDLRSRKAVEQRLNALQGQLVNMARVQAIDEMGAAIAHELNQPLTAVMLYLQAVNRKMGSLDEPEKLGPVHDILLRALREAERASGIIQRMRHSVERREPERQSSDLNALIDEAIELTLIGHNIDGLSVERDLDPSLSSVDVDPIQIQQVLTNLIRNALEAVRKSAVPRIALRSRIDEASAYVDIQDSGTGIPPEVAASLFKAFASTKRSGLGLGLMISRSIAQNHGGDLTVDPGGNGRGATFTLRLPLIVSQPSSDD
ncbi:MAG: PAS domain S-box protein [Ancalomicrobiaceae bacterium]|nr:PAS domain S-box protein [Ancalomicrobiaceae bacterium]